MTFEPLTLVVGAFGAEGGYATSIYNGDETALKPTEFLDSTLNV